MSASAQQPPAPVLFMTPAELFWLTAGLWLSGVCLLALLPVLLMPPLGPVASLAVSYVAFFLAWQPLHRITQRALGANQAFVRMLALVASAAMLAYYARVALMDAIAKAGA